ncbi:MAG TPA: hypothetical protein EYP33_06365 [Pyrodictium sp.]|nr:hypothetical protein [Pyrodictium sp.]
MDFATSHGGGWHRHVIEHYARKLVEQGYFVDVDKTGGEDRPDIVAVPSAGDDWDTEDVLCIEAEADPARHTTYDKLLAILQRCFRTACQRIVIVVPRRDDANIVGERLERLHGERRRVAAALGIPLPWLEALELRVEVHEEDQAREQPEEPEHSSPVLEALRQLLPRLLEEGAAAQDEEHVYITAKAVKSLEEATGLRIGSLTRLAEMISGAQPGRYYLTLAGQRRRARALALPRHLLEAADTPTANT